MQPMTTMMRAALSFLRDETGQDLAEYAIALAMIVIGVSFIAVAISGDVTTLWSNAQPILTTVIDSEP
jgi:Flp pilus assembly pilin Flp